MDAKNQIKRWIRRSSVVLDRSSRRPDDAPISSVDIDGELCVLASGPMPEFPRNKPSLDLDDDEDDLPCGCGSVCSICDDEDEDLDLYEWCGPYANHVDDCCCGEDEDC